MRKAGPLSWLLPETLTPAQLIVEISRKFQIQATAVRKTAVTCFDSFDWRLYRKKKRLVYQDGRWQLLRLKSGRPIVELPDSAPKPRQFAGDFPAGPLAARLTSVLGVRALTRVLTVDQRIQVLRVFNADEKTVAHINFRTDHISDTSVRLHTVGVKSVRGYDDAARRLIRFLHRCGVDQPVSPASLFTQSLAAAGRRPLDYSSRFSIDLTPDLTLYPAARKIFRQLLDTMHRNEAGIRADIDSEFLHDFRVAIRRTRSGLAQFKGVFPPDVTDTFKTAFAWLGQVTGPTRDLDVYLLFETDYMSRLPEPLGAGLAGFFTEMAAQRHGAWEKMVKTLQSVRYRQVMDDWQACLAEDEKSWSEYPDRPVQEAARQIIHRRYLRILKRGRAIGPASPDDDLHSLRIQCKKLRYSLEFFASLFPAAQMTRVIGQLKGLQNNLGAFNDLSVQQAMLKGYLATIRPGSRKNQDLAAAIGGLLAALFHEQKAVRSQFVTTFKTFSGMKNVKLFARLFG